MTAVDDTDAIQLYNEGLRSAKAEYFDEAIPLLERSIEADPSRVESYNVLGKVFFYMGQTSKARKQWKAAIELDPFNPTALACLNASGPARWLYKAMLSTLLVLLTVVLVWAFRSTRRYNQTVQMGSSIASSLVGDHSLASGERPSIADSVHSAQTDTSSVRSFSQDLVQASEHPSKQGDAAHTTQTDTLSVRSPSGQSDRIPVQPVLESGQPLSSHREQTPPSGETPIQTVQQVKQRYNAAMSAYQQKQFDRAIKEFKAILSVPFSHTLKDNAQYWIGECYYDQGEYERALTEFEQVPLLYPEGNKALHAQIKMVYCYARLGQHEQARALLTRLIQEHPQDPSVCRAWAIFGQPR